MLHVGVVENLNDVNGWILSTGSANMVYLWKTARVNLQPTLYPAWSQKMNLPFKQIIKYLCLILPPMGWGNFYYDVQAPIDSHQFHDLSAAVVVSDSDEEIQVDFQQRPNLNFIDFCLPTVADSIDVVMEDPEYENQDTQFVDDD